MRQHAFDDRHAKLGAHLPDDRPHPLAQLAAQHLVAVFGDPDDVVAMMENGVAAAVVGHILTPEEMDLHRFARSILSGVRIWTSIALLLKLFV